MKFLWMFLAVVTLPVFAAGPTELSVAIGGSVPAGSAYALPSGPSRATGGERFVFKFNGPKQISEIKITSFSTSRSGKALIHSAKGVTGATAVAIEGLYVFAKVTAGNPVNYQNKVMLPESAWVAVTPNQPYSQLEFVVEAFTHNDASVLVQITSPDGFAAPEFLLTRTGASSETAGSLIDETRYARFTGSDLEKLMTVASQPQANDLAGKTYVCSVYTRLESGKIDIKRRTYALAAGGGLISNSDLQGSSVPWFVGPEGLQRSIDNYTGCGRFPTANVVRRLASGNLVAEIILDLDKWVAQCVAQGFDPNGTKAAEESSSFPSVIDAKYRVDAYEFCRPVSP